MRIHDDHLYHGAALTQIAEHPQFTAINSFKDADNVSRSAFRVNNDIGVYFKYCTKPKRPFSEYIFTFTEANIAEIDRISNLVEELQLALVCVKDRHICCLDYSTFCQLIEWRQAAFGGEEDQYTVLVTLEEGKSFRVYVNQPGKRKTVLKKRITIARNKFPTALFS